MRSLPAATHLEPQTLRLMLSEGERVVLVDAVAVGDSVIGTPVGEGSGGRRAIGVGDIFDIRVRRLDPSQTTFLFIGVVVPVVAVVGLSGA